MSYSRTEDLSSEYGVSCFSANLTPCARSSDISRIIIISVQKLERVSSTDFPPSCYSEILIAYHYRRRWCQDCNLYGDASRSSPLHCRSCQVRRVESRPLHAVVCCLFICLTSDLLCRIRGKLLSCSNSYHLRNLLLIVLHPRSESKSAFLIMARNINDFPAELVRLVLGRVKSESRINRDGNFLNTLTTCRLWNQIGEELLYTDISLNKSELIKFCDASITALSWTKSLSITITPPMYESSSIYEGCDTTFRDPTSIKQKSKDAHGLVLQQLG